MDVTLQTEGAGIYRPGVTTCREVAGQDRVCGFGARQL